MTNNTLNSTLNLKTSYYKHTLYRIYIAQTSPTPKSSIKVKDDGQVRRGSNVGSGSVYGCMAFIFVCIFRHTYSK